MNEENDIFYRELARNIVKEVIDKSLIKISTYIYLFKSLFKYTRKLYGIHLLKSRVRERKKNAFLRVSLSA